MSYCVGGIAPQVNLRVNNPDIDTLETALCTRMYMCEVGGQYVEPPLPSEATVAAKLKNFKSRLQAFHSTPETLDEVVERYTGRKKVIYADACLSLLHRPLERKDAVSVSFVKPEKTNPTKAPRCIQPRDPRYNLELGAYLKHIEHRIYGRIAKIFGDGPTVMKGMNVQQIGSVMAGKWNSFTKPCAVGLDATKFDMHVSPAVLGWEHSIYMHIFRNCPKLRRLLDWQMNNVGSGFCKDGRLRYKVRGKRFSGDMNTAMGNCIIMCGLVYEYARERGIHVKLANNGDDCVVFMEQCNLRAFMLGLETWFLELGFRMVAEEPVYDLQKVEFCQMHPIRVNGKWCMVRNITAAMSKDAICLLPIRSRKELSEWLGAVGDCGSSLTAGVPIARAYYGLFQKSGTRRTKFGDALFRNSGVQFLRKGMVSGEDTITPEARYDVWLAWGLLPDHQVALEAKLSASSIEFGSEVKESFDEVPGLLV